MLLRLAVLTAVFYVLSAIVFEAVGFMLARTFGSFAFGGKPWVWIVFVGFFPWIISTGIAWHLLVGNAIKVSK